MAADHHPECDGWRHHSNVPVQLPSGTWKPSCPLCGVLPIIGSSSSRETALALGRDHNYFAECVGECGDW